MWNFLWFFCIPWIPVVSNVEVDNKWGWEVDRWEPVVSHIAEMYDATDEVDTFMRVMHCESRGDPDAYNESSGASGLMQHLSRFWDYRAEQVTMSGYSPFDPIANIHASFWLLTKRGYGGWVHWECY